MAAKEHTINSEGTMVHVTVLMEYGMVEEFSNT